ALDATVAIAPPPRLLERDRGQILGIREVAAPIAKEVGDARQLLGIHRVPVDLFPGDPVDDSRRHRALGRHSAEIYGAAAAVSQRLRTLDFGSRPLRWRSR